MNADQLGPDNLRPSAISAVCDESGRVGIPRFEFRPAILPTVKLNGIAAVSFDAGNTLLYCDPSPAEIYSTHLSRHGRRVRAEEVGPVFAEAWAEMQRRTSNGKDRYGSVAGGERAWWGAFVREVLVRLEHDAPWQPLLDDLYSAFCDNDVWKVFDDTVTTLDAMTAAGVRLAVISNWDHRLPEILDGLRLTGYFEAIVVSAIEGVEKPSPPIFARTLERLGLDPAAVLHVGDSPLEDYTGARDAGLRSLLIDRKGLFAGEPYDRVSSLDEILAILG
jgi:putative hydrolase of the HAD superfamily